MSNNETNLAKKRLISIFIIWGLIWGGIFTIEIFNFNIITGDSGAPPINGTKLETWYINLSVIRKNEWINTSDIQINNSASLEWINVTAEIFGNVSVNNSSYLNLTNCSIILYVNLTIN